MKLLFITILFFQGLNTFANSKTKGEIKESKENYLIVGTPSLKGFQDSFIQLQAGKIAVNVLAKSKKYLLMFTAAETLGKDTEFKRLEMNITKKGQIYDLDITIMKIASKNKIIDKTVGAKDIEKRFLLLQIRKSMYELLYGKEYLKKMQDQLKKENEKDKRQLNGLLKEGLGPKKVSDALAQIISDIKLSKTILKDRQKEFDEEFAKKVQAEKNLNNRKSNIREALRRERKKIERDKTDREFRGKEKDKGPEFASRAKKTKSNEKAALESSGGNFGDSSYSRNQFNKKSRPRGTRLFAQVAGLNRVSDTDFILNGVTNSFFLAGFKGTARVEVIPGLGDDFVFSFFYLTNVTDTSLEIPDIKNFELMYLSTAGFIPFDMYFGVHYENQYFINILADDGEGKQVVENQFIWFQIGIERVFRVWKILLIPQLGFSKNAIASSNLSSDVQLDGTKVEVGGEIGYKNYRLGIKYMQDSVTSTNLSNFKTEQTSTFFTLSYVFM